LRACPDKIGGTISMGAAILILAVIPTYTNLRSKFNLVLAPFSSLHKVSF